MRIASLVPVLIAAPFAAAVVSHPAVDAAPKAKVGACGSLVLPLVEGNQWTYSKIETADAPLPSIARQVPIPPKAFTITISKIEQKGEETLVSLTEKYTYDYTKDATKKQLLEDRTVSSTITCSAKKFDISPDSFFFAAEPGGVAGMKLDSVVRKGTTWQLAKGNFGDNEWADDVTVQWTKVTSEKAGVKPVAGKIELERRYQPLVPEEISTKVEKFKAEAVGLKTTGRITLTAPMNADLQPYLVPADWITKFWFVPGTGLVRTINPYGHVYELVDSQLK